MAKLRVLSDIVIAKFAELPARLVDLLRSRNFNTIEVDKIEKLEEAIKGVAKPILLAFSGANSQITNSSANKLAGVAGLQSLPVVFVGKEIQKHERMLSQAFEVVATLEYPCEQAEILDLILSVSDYAEKLRSPEQDKKAAPPAKEDTSSPQDKLPDTSIKQVASEVTQKIAIAADKVAETVLSVIAELNLRGKDLGASVLVQTVGSSYFTTRDLLPKNHKERSKIEELLARTNRFGTMHLFKVADVSSKIIDVLNVNPDIKDSARSAAFLYSASFAQDAHLMSRDYTTKGAEKLREHLSKHIANSARIVLAETGSKETASIVTVVSEIVAGKGCNDSDDGVVASSIVAADVMDRVCWGSGGRWNSNSVYSFMQRLRKGDLIQIHPKVLSCVVITLTEAVNTKVSTLLMPRLSAEDRKLVEERRTQFISQERGDDEIRLCVHEILPGMVLARPLQAYDGSVILNSGVVLDGDMILRLWQLTTVKPLLVPVISLQKTSPLLTNKPHNAVQAHAL